MITKIDRNATRKRRHLRVRKKISGTSECPRLCMYRSNTNIYAQVIDDVAGNTTDDYIQISGVKIYKTMQGEISSVSEFDNETNSLDITYNTPIQIGENTKITVSGMNKQEVGDIAALIRSKRPPEVYKGKGIRYEGEHIRKKAGKAGKK